MGTEFDTIESRLVRVTTKKKPAAFHNLGRRGQKCYVTTKIYGKTCKLRTHYFLR